MRVGTLVRLDCNAWPNAVRRHGKLWVVAPAAVEQHITLKSLATGRALYIHAYYADDIKTFEEGEEQCATG